ncbi:hypothetical protein QQF64_007395 [Cirrhinus molitorella]|uniref:Uncharacterized protein n=1 Tax=Cirrhinus molitorella TaxID=172907 RepID=A0ABR3MAJ2_9TELE
MAHLSEHFHSVSTSKAPRPSLWCALYVVLRVFKKTLFSRLAFSATTDQNLSVTPRSVLEKKVARKWPSHLVQDGRKHAGYECSDTASERLTDASPSLNEVLLAQRREDATAIDDTEETKMGEHHWSPVSEETDTKATDNRQPFENSRTDASFSMIVTRCEE